MQYLFFDCLNNSMSRDLSVLRLFFVPWSWILWFVACLSPYCVHYALSLRALPWPRFSIFWRAIDFESTLSCIQALYAHAGPICMLTLLPSVHLCPLVRSRSKSLEESCSKTHRKRATYYAHSPLDQYPRVATNQARTSPSHNTNQVIFSLNSGR